MTDQFFEQSEKKQPTPDVTGAEQTPVSLLSVSDVDMKLSGASDIAGSGSVIRINSQDDGSYRQLSGFEKAWDAGTGAVADAPSAYFRELRRDFTEDPGNLAFNVGTGAAVGFGATGLLKAAPKRGKYVLGALVALQAVHYGARAIDYLAEATGLETRQDRDNLVARGADAIAREGVILTEATPGAMLGGFGAVRAFGKPQLFVEGEQFVSRQWAFNGPGSRRLTPDIKQPGGKIDALKLNDSFGGGLADADLSYEVARSANLFTMKQTGPIKGSVTRPEVNRGFLEKVGDISQHSHLPDAPAGHLPSINDVAATRHLGIINQGDKTTFYIGKMQEFEGLLSRGLKPEDIRLPIQGVTLDRTGAIPTATLFESQPLSSNGAGSRLLFENRVDFLEAEKALRSLDLGNAWTQLKSLKSP
ncbi:MAG: hypothetical protein H6677_17165 [Candidatus Obscuribacterales bacterium]|nr:hypothetical protein [Candidatus Obscuribacterales bacterium]